MSVPVFYESRTLIVLITSRLIENRKKSSGFSLNFHPKLDYFLLFLLSSAYLRGFVFSRGINHNHHLGPYSQI